MGEHFTIEEIKKIYEDARNIRIEKETTKRKNSLIEEKELSTPKGKKLGYDDETLKIADNLKKLLKNNDFLLDKDKTYINEFLYAKNKTNINSFISPIEQFSNKNRIEEINDFDDTKVTLLITQENGSKHEDVLHLLAKRTENVSETSVAEITTSQDDQGLDKEKSHTNLPSIDWSVQK